MHSFELFSFVLLVGFFGGSMPPYPVTHTAFAAALHSVGQVIRLPHNTVAAPSIPKNKFYVLLNT